MQTFLPFESFRASIRCLDNKRLGKQRVEALQLLNGQWRNHPCAKMWKDYPAHLAEYLSECIVEWRRRGFKNTIVVPLILRSELTPPWLGDERVHSSHRASLLYKLPSHYEQFGWEEDPKLGYYWPV